MARAGIPTEIITLPRVCCTVSLLQLSLPLVALSLFFSSLLAADRRAAGGLRRQQQQLRRNGGTLAPLHMQT